MKQSYIYKFIFLCNIFASTSSLYASNIHNYAQYHSSWNVAKFNFNHCNPSPLEINGVPKSLEISYFNGAQANCNVSEALTFNAQQSSILFDVYFNTDERVALFASLYKVVNNDKIFVRDLRFIDAYVLNGLETNTSYEIVFYQNQFSLPIQATLTATYDLPITTFNGPYVQVDTTEYTYEELVTDVLIDNECVQVSNVTWAAGLPTNPSIAYFDGNNSIFPFEDGIILSTGYATLANGPKQGIQGQSNGLGTDPQLNAILQSQNIFGSSNNTTKLEFDFVPVSNQISFNFIFASEEYDYVNCSFTDVFAFLLTDMATGVTTNLAVVPNTNTPIMVHTVWDNTVNPGCPSANAQYFSNFYPAGNQTAPINFAGHTVALTAQSTVVPGNSYHIKLAIADVSDTGYDSAVFIEGGSFDIGSVDLGDDFLEENQTALCYNDSYLLESGLDPDLFEIQWFLDDEPISGATEPNYLVEVNGVYKVEGMFIGTECAITDEIIVEMYPNIKTILNKPEDIEICSNTNDYVDLTQVEDGVLGEYNPSEFDFEYYLSLEDLENQINKVSNPVMYDTSEGTLIYMRIISTETECEDYFSFRIIIKADPIVTEFEDVMICNNFVLPEIQSNEKYFTGPNQTGVEYQPGHVLGIGTHKIYVLGEIDGCFGETSFTVDVIPCNIPNGISPNGDGLNDNLDLTYFRVANIEIYNRHGKVVYSHGLGYTNQWHGQDNSGGLLPDGTYFYKIYTVLDEFTGWIQINR